MRLERVIDCFPEDIIFNAEMMELLRRAFEKANARAYLCQKEKHNKEHFSVNLKVNDAKRVFSYSHTKKIKLSDGKKTEAYIFKIRDENLRNDFTIVSLIDANIVYVYGTLENEKVNAISYNHEKKIKVSRNTQNLAEKDKEKIEKKSLGEQQDILCDNIEKYFTAFEAKEAREEKEEINQKI